MSLKFVIYTPEINYRCGGVIVLHKLAEDLLKRAIDVKLWYETGKVVDNPFCNDFASSSDIDDNTVVVYPEIIQGNPLNAKNVIRWILCDLGIHTEWEIFGTWSPKDLIYHYSSFNDRYRRKDIEILCTSWMNPKVKNFKIKRSGSCFLMKKALLFHSTIKPMHPDHSVSIEEMDIEDVIKTFNQKEIFYCYDPYSFYDLIALQCGCIPVIYPLEGISKESWMGTRSSFDYLKTIGENIAGLAYGVSEIPYAQKTHSKADTQLRQIESFEQNSIDKFLETTQRYFINPDPSVIYKTVKQARSTLGWSIPFWMKCKKFLNQRLKKC